MPQFAGHPAIIEAGHCGDLLELGPDLVGVERRPVPMAEQKIVLVPWLSHGEPLACLSCLVGGQSRHGDLSDAQTSAWPPCSRVASMPVGAKDVDHRLVQIDVGPAERTRLFGPDTGHETQDDVSSAATETKIHGVACGATVGVAPALWMPPK